jgi:hypothetical protein
VQAATALIILFLLAALAGSRIEKNGFWPLVAALSVVLAVMCVVWHDINEWPGWLSPAFSTAAGAMLLTISLGLFFGGFVLEKIKIALAQREN